MSMTGRWDGKLTSRPLPENDPSIDELTPFERERLAETWLLRAAMERRVGDSFAVVRDALRRRGAAQELVDLAERAIDDESRHEELSRVVASRFAGKELALPARLPLEVPAHKGASPELRDTLHIIGQCVFNETTASAYLECSLDHANDGTLAKSALRELLSDEIDHGRIGWAHLASLDERTRATVAPWLHAMAFTNLKEWRKETPYDATHSEAMTKQGVPPASVVHEALVDALRTLIIPGFEELQMDVSALKKWVDEGASTEKLPV
jgi:hypothetical protein